MSKPQHHLEGHHPIVLVVDDNPAIRDMVSWALELDGYEPAEATEKVRALKRQRGSQGAAPDAHGARE